MRFLYWIQTIARCCDQLDEQDSWSLQFITDPSGLELLSVCLEAFNQEELARSEPIAQECVLWVLTVLNRILVCSAELSCDSGSVLGSDQLNQVKPVLTAVVRCCLTIAVWQLLESTVAVLDNVCKRLSMGKHVCGSSAEQTDARVGQIASHGLGALLAWVVVYSPQIWADCLRIMLQMLRAPHQQLRASVLLPMKWWLGRSDSAQRSELCSVLKDWLFNSLKTSDASAEWCSEGFGALCAVLHKEPIEDQRALVSSLKVQLLENAALVQTDTGAVLLILQGHAAVLRTLLQSIGPEEKSKLGSKLLPVVWHDALFCLHSGYKWSTVHHTLLELVAELCYGSTPNQASATRVEQQLSRWAGRSRWSNY